MASHRKAADAQTEAEDFSTLFRSCYGQIVSFARRRVGPDACQEIAAETFLVAWQKFDSVPDKPLPWLYQVAGFTIANYQRRENRSVPFGASADFDQLMASPASDDDSVTGELVKRAFVSLNPKDQEILRLAAWDGLSSAVGAAVLGCSIAAYKVRLHRARSRLTKNVPAAQIRLLATDSSEGATTSSPEAPSPFRAAEETA